MLKFRFRKQHLRRRSNSCPNLERPNEDTSTEQNVDATDATIYQESNATAFESESESESLPRKERLIVQRSIRRIKKKEKEKQENSEKNLLSMDDYYGKLALLKEWLLDQGKKDIDKITSPKLKSHFKSFIKLWNKRKLPAKFYRSCCVDTVEASVNPDEPSSPLSPLRQLYANRNGVPSYHRFPPVDEPDTPWKKSLFCSPSPSKAKLAPNDTDSPFSTFGKSVAESDSSESYLSFQMLHGRESQQQSMGNNMDRNSKKVLNGNSATSPSKFASIARSMPASSMFKPSTLPLGPKLHPVMSPTCPLISSFCDQNKALPTSFYFGTIDSSGKDRQSPAYMCVKDAVHYESPEYSQIGEFFSKDPVFNKEFSPFRQCSTQDIEMLPERRQRASLNRRRSKSVEDIYAVPFRVHSMAPRAFSPTPDDEDYPQTPPVPEKKFYPLSPVSPKGTKETSFSSVREQKDLKEFIQFVFPSRNESTNISNEPVNVYPISQIEKAHSSKSLVDNNHSSSSTSVTLGNSQYHSPISPQKPDLKRRSEEDENCGSEKYELSKKVKPAIMTQSLSTPIKTSNLTGSLNHTTRTPKPDPIGVKVERRESRLSILQIKQLDSSPTFPRRRVKRRSSSFSTTPGKGFKSRNKNSTIAKSSPRRVSFAKDVKDKEDKSTQRTSAGRLITKGRECKNEIKRQSKERKEFESFISQHSPTKEKNTSPKERSPGKVWSPPKWLSPSKQLRFSSIESPSTESMDHSSPDKLKQTSSKNLTPVGSPSKIKESLITSLSPSKVVSRIKRNISSSLLQKENSKADLFAISENENGMSSMQQETQPPKSILKNKDHIRSFKGTTSSENENQTCPTRQVGRQVIGPPPTRSQIVNRTKSSNIGTRPVSLNFKKTGSLNWSYVSQPNLFDKKSTDRFGDAKSFECAQKSDEDKNTEQKKYRDVEDNNVNHAFPNASIDTDLNFCGSKSLTYEKSFPYSTSKTNLITASSHSIMDENSKSSNKSKAYKESILDPNRKFEDEGDYATLIHCDNFVDNDTANAQNLPTKVDENSYFHHQKLAQTDCNIKEIFQTDPYLTDAVEIQNESNVDTCIQNQKESGSNDECNLSRLESMKASQNVVENDSWITARRKSSIRYKKKISRTDLTSDMQSLSSRVIDEERASSNNVEENKFSVSMDLKTARCHQNEASANDNISDVYPYLVTHENAEKNSHSDFNDFESILLGTIKRSEPEIVEYMVCQGDSELLHVNRKLDEADSAESKSSFGTDNADKKLGSESESDSNKQAPIKKRPKPAVKPKPSLNSTNSLSNQQKSNANILLSRPTVKKRTSLLKKESPRSPRQSSSFKAVSSCGTSYRKNSIAEQKSPGNCRISSRFACEKRRSSLTPKKRRSASNGVSEICHPHIASFAQRRNFFQQIEQSSSSSSLKSVSKLTQSASKAQIRPRPAVKPKPRRSKIGNSSK